MLNFAHIFNLLLPVKISDSGITLPILAQNVKNYELFAESNMAHLVSKGNMTAQDARKNFEDNVPPMSKAYAKDGQENFVKRGDYTKGYIFDDFVFCNRILK